MPELPEVETTCRGLRPALLAQDIARVEVFRRDLRWPIPAGFEAAAVGRRITSIDRRAKYILMQLDSGARILSHLGMSGRFSVHAAPPKAWPTHSHVVLHLASGGAVAYTDPRRFGMLDILTPGQSHPLLNGLGIEPLSPELTPAWLAAAFAGKAAPIKSALLDQRIIAGLGNIYVCEALFLSGIHPAAPARHVPLPHLERLAPAIKQVLEAAITAGGSSLRDHRQTDGKLGYFQKQFQVYGREKEACFTCGTPVRRMVQGGRSTFFCGECQE
jgi:formamidopyrimidine-DNA glycosylase